MGGALLSREKVASQGLEVLLQFKLLLRRPFIQRTVGMGSVAKRCLVSRIG